MGTSLSLQVADRVAHQVTSGAVSIVFTPASAVPSGGTITIATPLNYFAARSAGAPASGSSISCASACSGVSVGDVTFANVGASGALTVVVSGGSTTASAITVTLGAGTLTTGSPQASTSGGITVSPSKDYASAGVA